MIIISTTRESRISDNVELKENGGRIRESFPAWQDFYILLGVALHKQVNHLIF